MGVVDLDAARAARAETGLEDHAIRFGGQEFTLPAELPYRVAELWSRGEAAEGWAALLGDQWEAFMALGPTSADMGALLEGITPLYGIGTPGESSASNGSSPRTSKRSRPTS